MLHDPHSVRLEANRELQARPFPHLSADICLFHICIRISPNSNDHVFLWIKEKIKDLPEDFDRHWERGESGPWVRIDRHTEFVAITQLASKINKSSNVAESRWIDQAPEDILVLCKLKSSVGGPMPERLEACSTMRGGEVVVGTIFTPDASGCSNWIVNFEKDPGPEASGRLLQMVLEIETYRTLAVTGMDQIRAVYPILQTVANNLPKDGTIARDHVGMMETLDRLSGEESKLHNIWERLAWRVGANAAYHELVFERLEQLKAKGLDGHVGIRHFLKRRLTPAISTAQTIMRRRSELANQVDERAQLLRTQLQLNLQSQTRDLLASLDRSAETQIRLQKAVEGLSTVAIAYYAVGLLSPVLEPFVTIEHKIWIKAILAPVVLGAVWLILSRIRKKFVNLG